MGMGTVQNFTLPKFHLPNFSEAKQAKGPSRNYSRFINSSTQKKEDRHDLKYAVACSKRVKRWLASQGSFIEVPAPPAHIQEKIIFIRGMKDELDMEALANG